MYSVDAFPHETSTHNWQVHLTFQNISMDFDRSNYSRILISNHCSISQPPGRQIRPRTRSSSHSSYSSHSSHSSYSSISRSRSRSRSVSSVSSYSSISSSESDMSPQRPSSMKGIDGKRLPPDTRIPKGTGHEM